MMDSHAIHRALGASGWRDVLESAGVSESLLAKKPGPCPCCGGKDRYVFDNKHGHGDYFCRQCGPGDGFKLLMVALQVTFSEARRRVIEIARLEDSSSSPKAYARPQIVSRVVEEKARPTRRVVALLKESCHVEDCDPAAIYVMSRSLWPLPKQHSLRAHPSVEYWQDKKCIGRFPALIAAVRDINGELVTVHVTYLDHEGEKLQGMESRKILSPLSGRNGCAVPLMPIDGQTVGIAEGIETALSAAAIHKVPTWAALNTSLLAKWQPPAEVQKVVIFADRDVAGLQAATQLMERLQDRVRLEIRTPQAKDWNDVLRGVK